MNSPEQFHGTPEHGSEAISAAAAERSAELRKQPERSVENAAETSKERLETARHETEALFSRESGTEQKAGGEPGFARTVKRITSQQKRAAYAQTMQRIRSEMSAPARAFSRFIHNRGVERASGVLGTTVARPNAILSGSTSALILVSLVYIVAKIFGYPLSGFETIGAFIFGWAIGLAYDYTRTLVTGKTQ